MDFNKHAYILAVIEGLRKQRSWTGKTHVQKTLFLLESAFGLPLPFQFILYKHGPYSFDVEEELERMKSYEAIRQTAVPAYGVVLQPGELAGFLKKVAPLKVEEEDAISRVCEFVGTKDVKDLERLATAAWIRKREGVMENHKIAERLHELKPHIPIHEALRASNEASPLFA